MPKSFSSANVHFASTVNEVPVEVCYDDELVHSGRRLKQADLVEAKLLDEWFEQEETQPSVSRRFRRVGQRIHRLLVILFLLVAAVAAFIVVRIRQSAIETLPLSHQLTNVTVVERATPSKKKVPEKYNSNDLLFKRK